MFKRVEKRRRRKEEEAETSLNEELKEIMGFNDTDSDESTSESDSSDEEGEFAQDDEGDDEGDPKISVSQALLDPIFVVSLFPEVKACMVCPGKQLKGEKMVELHRISNAHARRFRRFKDNAANAQPTDDALEVFQSQADVNPISSMTASTNAISKRVQKLASFRERRKLRRKAIQEKKAAKQAERAATAASGSATISVVDEHSSKAKTSEKLRPKDSITHGHDSTPSPNLTPKKKRRIDESKGDVIPLPRTTASNAVAKPPSPSPKPTKKRKVVVKPKKEPVNARPVGVLSTKKVGKDTEDVGTSAEQKKNREVITKIVRSTADRAKSARAHAATMFKARKKIS